MTSSPQYRRRRLLQLAAVCASPWCLPRSAWCQPRLRSYPFTLGVASGSPTSDSVVLWTRLLMDGAEPGAAPIAVRWELAHDEQFTRMVQTGWSRATPELAHAVHVEVTALASDRWYWYRFIVGDAVSASGRTRTLPVAGATVQRLRLAYASCQKWEDGYFTAWRHMRAENLDLVMFLGDYIYEYPGTNSKVRVPGGGWVRSLDDYRRRYALYKGDADLQAMHGACPWLMTWDDHEVQNDYAGMQAGDSGAADRSSALDFPLRRADAYQAYYEHMPLRTGVLARGLAGLGEGAEMRIYHRLDYGQLAGLYLLDARQYRTAQVCNPGNRLGSSMVNPAGCADWHDPKRSLLGWSQEQWLYGELSQSRARQNLLERAGSVNIVRPARPAYRHRANVLERRLGRLCGGTPAFDGCVTSA